MKVQIGPLVFLTFCSLGLISITPGVIQAQESDQTIVPVPDETVNLSGTWLLDKRASDDLKQIMAPANSQGMRGGGGMGGRGGGMGGHGGGGGRGGGMKSKSGGANQERMMRNMKDLEKEISQLEIFQTGDEFNVTDGMDISHMVFTDGRENTIWTRQGKAKAIAEWHGQTLKIQINANSKKQGQVRHYTLSKDGTKLTVLYKKAMGPGGELRTISLVYRRN